MFIRIATIIASCFIMTHSFAASDSFAVNQLVYQIRNPGTDSKDFRRALEKIGEYLALDVFEELDTIDVPVTTLTDATTSHLLCNETPVLVTVLRAGLPLCYGVHKVFPDSPIGFLAMSRNEETLQPKIDYVALPDLKNKTVLVIDTMIATGGSLFAAIKILEEQNPKQILVIGAIASQYGIDKVHEYNPNIKVIAAAVDPSLNDKGYIVPGLGDAGDRSYGKKFSCE